MKNLLQRQKQILRYAQDDGFAEPVLSKAKGLVGVWPSPRFSRSWRFFFRVPFLGILRNFATLMLLCGPKNRKRSPRNCPGLTIAVASQNLPPVSPLFTALSFPLGHYFVDEGSNIPVSVLT